ncbi:hypothetical protein JZO66_07900 [Enterococcus sp. DIV0242_7C1]|uniref:Uncharacterized protein n=1 Tax=Candidatus Enterococcus dunnyi TaxID=1834192 RepID=A0A200JDF2_9ENTE|nr:MULTISPECIES: hypothetical protein [unclassified Enterococcus]MBO0470466.1 hypothetical protein [Enterococcus sp. DIV0242_7C1]OUZ34881.1 hypothetical protein A5889_000356 [Enterococcus sp. 9D6_DIV0238]
MLPSYLVGIANVVSIADFLELEIVLDNLEESYEILHSGELFLSGNNQLITSESNDKQLKIIAKNEKNGRELLLFDSALYGYNTMFCDTIQEFVLDNNELKRYPVNDIYKINLSIGIGINYDEEKEDYEIDDHGFVTLIDGRKVSWDQVKSDGFDYIGIKITTKDLQMFEILSEELS